MVRALETVVEVQQAACSFHTVQVPQVAPTVIPSRKSRGSLVRLFIDRLHLRGPVRLESEMKMFRGPIRTAAQVFNALASLVAARAGGSVSTLGRISGM
jgi:hypothetical protein